MAQLHILTPSGLLDAVGGADLRNAIGSLLNESPRDVLINCTDIQFMDSSGFGSLVSTLKRVKEHGQRLFLSNVNAQMRMVLELTGTNCLFIVFSDQQACLDFLAAGLPKS